MKAYETLFPLVIQEIEKRTGREITSVGSRFSVQPGGEGGSLDSRATSEMIAAIVSDLSEIIGAKIISGLDVSATTPPSSTVNITAGTATSHGKKWTLTEDTTTKIPFDSSTYLFFVTIYNNTIEISRTYDSTRCELCRIVVPNPGTTSAIVDDKPSDGYDAYIVSAKDIVYKEDQEFDDASVEKLRDVIGDILADNLIGNIRLSENLKIINTQGILELDSSSVKIKDIDANILAKFDRNGTFFYDIAGRTLAKFARDEAYIGNILITKNSIETRNFVAKSQGFQIKDNGDAEFNSGTFRGTLSANIGNIGGWTLAANELYATTTGTIKTSINVGAGYNGVILDKNGLRVYDDVLGEVVDLPADGSAPTFSRGIINSTIFEIQTNAVLRTSETVGDGSANSAGILINNTGIYGCEANQTLSYANFKILDSGDAYFNGEIRSIRGQIGNVVINENGLFGGLIEGSLIRSPVIESSADYPRIKLDALGFYYLVTPSVGQYGEFKYGDVVASGAGIHYGAGTLAYLFRKDYPVLSIMAEQNVADIRLYNRSNNPASGTHAIGDLISVSGVLKICTIAGTPGTFTVVGSQS